jgi:prevent-host-death family protein
MQIYTYSEAKQKLSSVLDKAEAMGKVVIRQKDERTFVLIPEETRRSPFDLPSIRANVSTEELVEIVKKGRRKTGGWRRRLESPVPHRRR